MPKELVNWPPNATKLAECYMSLPVQGK